MVKNKRTIPVEARMIKFDLFHNGLYQQKIMPNKKKKLSKKRIKIKSNTYFEKL